MNKFFKFCEQASDVIYPENLYCVCCGDLIPPGRVHALCDECISHLSWLSENPFESSLEGFSFDSVLSLVSYDFYAQRIVHDLKFHGKPYIAKPIGKLMGELYLDVYGKEPAQAALFVPVPMYIAKERSRGYNQAALLAKYSSKAAGADCMDDALIKNKRTDSMRTARAIGRLNAIDNSIELNIARATKLKDRDIVLVDDVITTGATAQACCEALRMASPKSLTVLSFAAVKYKGNQ